MTDFYKKYLKYKTKYFNLKQNGGLEPIFYNIGDKKYEFKFKKIFEIGKASSAIFIKNKIIVTVKSGQLLLIDDYKNKPLIKEIKNMNSTKNFTAKDMEEGLLGVELNNNKIYLCYTIKSSDKRFSIYLVVDEYLMDDLDIKFTKNIIHIPFRTSYHHGGHLLFGPDNKLYLGTGDGGPQNDPYNESQNMAPLAYAGKILRINTDTLEVEIVALGLRNPWKFSFDSRKRMFIGDVGYESLEEINLIEDLNRRYNFGWSYFEGSRMNKSGKKFENFDPPIFEYPTGDKHGRAIIGGYFIDQLGIYVFADFLGFVRAIHFNGQKWIQIAENKLDDKIYSLAYDGDDIYILGESGIYKMVVHHPLTNF